MCFDQAFLFHSRCCSKCESSIRTKHTSNHTPTSKDMDADVEVIKALPKENSGYLTLRLLLPVMRTYLS